MVPIKKKNGERKLWHRFSEFELSFIQGQLLHYAYGKNIAICFGVRMHLLWDVISGYNQVLVAPQDQLKTTFRTKWGTYTYKNMSFGLINVGATFQRAMDVAFRGLINNAVVVYLDDITMFSKNRQDHLIHLWWIFNWCKKYIFSLKPKKSIFVVTEGRLLRFMVSKEGMKIDLKRIEVIS